MPTTLTDKNHPSNCRTRVGSGSIPGQWFETLQHADRVISDWIGFYKQRLPHQALGMKTPTQTYQSWKIAV